MLPFQIYAAKAMSERRSRPKIGLESRSRKRFSWKLTLRRAFKHMF